jgi:hypothetical protein
VHYINKAEKRPNFSFQTKTSNQFYKNFDEKHKNLEKFAKILAYLALVAP